MKVIIGKHILCKEVKVAKTLFQKMKGLIGLKNWDLNKMDGLILEKCNSIHMLFMKVPVCVVFLSKTNVVLKISKLKPWTGFAFCLNADKVLELPVDKINDIKIGNKLLIHDRKSKCCKINNLKNNCEKIRNTHKEKNKNKKGN